MKELREQDIELIERVLSQSASQEDIATFNARASEPEFAARVELIKNIRSNIRAGSDQFEEILESIHQNYQHDPIIATPAKQPSAFRKYFYVAASLALLIAAVFVFRGFNGQVSLDQLYTDNFSVPAENITTRDNAGVDDNLIAAVNFYRQEDFKNAILNFNIYLQKNPEDDGANFYAAVSYMADGQYEPAMKFFQRVISSQDSIYRSAAQWYLGLTYLKSNDLAAARSVFSELSDSNSSYAAKSKSILQQLEGR